MRHMWVSNVILSDRIHAESTIWFLSMMASNQDDEFDECTNRITGVEEEERFELISLLPDGLDGRFEVDQIPISQVEAPLSSKFRRDRGKFR